MERLFLLTTGFFALCAFQKLSLSGIVDTDAPKGQFQGKLKRGHWTDLPEKKVDAKEMEFYICKIHNASHLILLV
jgi:hypothetical protein